MKGIYTGDRIPMVGSFIMFMQSPSGWLCIILMVYAIIAVPIIEKNIKKRIDARLILMGLVDNNQEKTQHNTETSKEEKVKEQQKED